MRVRENEEAVRQVRSAALGHCEVGRGGAVGGGMRGRVGRGAVGGARCRQREFT